MMEGSPLKIILEPTGKTRSLNTYYSGKSIGEEANVLYYRIPDVVKMSLMLGSTEMAKQRISIYQSGSIVSTPL
jgi:hypothetical protein